MTVQVADVYAHVQKLVLVVKMVMVLEVCITEDKCPLCVLCSQCKIYS
jgi:hypothetical protein